MLHPTAEGAHSSGADDDALRRRILDLIAEGVLPFARPDRFTMRVSQGSTSCIACDARFVVGEPECEAVCPDAVVGPLHRHCFVMWLGQVG